MPEPIDEIPEKRVSGVNSPNNDPLAATAKSVGAMSVGGMSQAPRYDPSKFGPTGMPLIHVKLMTALILVMRIGSHYDGGALAALYGDDEERMETELELTSSMQGLIVTVGYVGLVIGCVLAAFLIKRFSTKNLLLCSMVTLCIGCVLFATAEHLVMLIFARIFVGLGQALQTVLYPVWADEFAPVKSASAYLAALQAGGPLGIVVGFLVTGFVQNNTGLSWRWTFYFQIFLLGPIFLVILLVVPKEYLDISPQKDQVAAEEFRAKSVGAPTEPGMDDDIVADAETPPRTRPVPPPVKVNADGDELEEEDVMEQVDRSLKMIKVIATNGLIICATLVLSSLYFVVNGLQTWVVDYIGSNESSVDADENTVVGTFGFTAATAPVSGIVFGGIVLAKLGGYRKYPSRTTFAGLLQGILAVSFAYGSLLMDNFAAFIAMVWGLLFFGGAMVPGLVGLIVSSVRRSYRSTASSFAGFFYNLLGYALGPLVGGVVADQFSSEEVGSVWGFRVIMGFSAVALLLQMFIWLYCRKSKHLEPMPEDRPLYVDPNEDELWSPMTNAVREPLPSRAMSEVEVPPPAKNDPLE